MGKPDLFYSDITKHFEELNMDDETISQVLGATGQKWTLEKIEENPDEFEEFTFDMASWYE